MNEKLPYEEQLTQAWDQLPLPDEDMAWKDMKRRLEKDDDERIIVPPPRRGCGLGILLIVILFIGGFWLLVRPEKWLIRKDAALIEELKADSSLKEGDKIKNEIEVKDEKENADSNTFTSKNTSRNDIDQNKTGQEVIIETKQAGATNTKKTSEPLTIKPEIVRKYSPEGPSVIQSEILVQDAKTRTRKRKQPVPVKTDKGDKSIETGTGIEQQKANEESESDKKKRKEIDKKLVDPSTLQEIDSAIQKMPDQTKTDPKAKDSTTVKRPDSINVNQVTAAKESQPVKDKEKRLIFFSAGIGLHQQIPVGGQEWTTYSSLGRKGILTDYIPSINFRMEKQERWFLQTEFRYGAPQHNKQLTFDQVIKLDTPSQSTMTTSSVLKKTFYHQVPLTFNYYVAKNWSVGVGVQWNRFYSAVAEEDLKRRSFGSQTDSLVGKSIIKISSDSAGAFARAWWQASVQSQFQWKRFSIGARYSFGLQPYIRFTLPGQPLQEEKNSSLQLFLRYELWRSKQ